MNTCKKWEQILNSNLFWNFEQLMEFLNKIWKQEFFRKFEQIFEKCNHFLNFCTLLKRTINLKKKKINIKLEMKERKKQQKAERTRKETTQEKPVQIGWTHCVYLEVGWPMQVVAVWDCPTVRRSNHRIEFSPMSRLERGLGELARRAASDKSATALLFTIYKSATARRAYARPQPCFFLFCFS